jgi:nucleotide-binding universal stress UspA family protein
MKINRILIGIDDSKFSDNAAAYGFDIARMTGAEVGLVNIVEPIIFPSTNNDTITGSAFETSVVPDAELINVQTESSENILERTTKKLAGELKVTQFTDYGSTADGILKCSAEFGADLVIIGTHSRSGLDRLLMGSVAEHVVRHSEVPVLVVPLREVD